MKYFSREEIKGDEREYFINALQVENIESKQIKEINVKHVCVENDIYALDGSTEPERQLIEKMYDEIFEKGYDDLYKILTDETKLTVTAEERYSIISFVVSMFYRNNSWHSFHNQAMNEMFERVYNFTKTNDKDSFFFGDQEISIAGKTLEELQKENKKQDRPMIAAITAQKIFQLTRWRVLNDVVTIIKKRGDFEFITSDNPVSFKGKDINNRPLPFDATNSLWLPIDNEHLLQLQPWAHELDWNMLGRMNDSPFPGFIASMSNNFQRNQAGRFVLGTETGLKAFQAKPNGIFPANSQ